MLLQRLWLTFLGLCVVWAQNFYDNSPHIMELTPKSFDKVVHKTNYTTLVEFYAPWCGYCKMLKPILQRAAKNLDGIVQVASVNCDLAKNKQLCAKYRVEGFPTLMVFRPPKVDLSKKGKDRPKLGNHASEVYKGERKLRPIVDFSISRVKNYVTRITRLDKLVQNLNQNTTVRYKAVLFSKKDKISPLYKSLALDWLGTVDFSLFLNSKLSTPSEALQDLHPEFQNFLSELRETTNDLDKSLLVLFDIQDHKYYIYEEESFEKANIWKMLSKFASPNEGPFTKRQEFLDALKFNKKIRKQHANKRLEHDEL
ncbi:LAQU0S01e04060g1_1 [Lachancea quebecensis]|uniref:LAQU0S01e04060g1_1 n=1 Tax=Lachancea quebecensis TaxID=1654605 RepID=A0A0P1KL31_9SACH|nr:LAQU0S01e04060g1_1 [Lachancea quebecensis]